MTPRFFTTAALRSDRERRAATTGGRGVRVLDDELRAVQIVLVVDLGADEVLIAHRVDQQLDAVLVHHGVVFVDGLVERESVLEARAAAALHEHAQLQLRVAFLVDQLLDLVSRCVGKNEGTGHFSHGGLGDSVHSNSPKKLLAAIVGLFLSSCLSPGNQGFLATFLTHISNRGVSRKRKNRPAHSCARRFLQ
ncbi:hypothetical protein PT2222_160055 [Paraburkholderia tropica]